LGFDDDFCVSSDSVFVNDFCVSISLCALKISLTAVEKGFEDDFWIATDSVFGNDF
jgi:hypothetical protein